ncbi:MAG: flagellar assembly peptidoglycan hydrolase FlgJ [Betaproteobacteria bacterium HGW-Betaproteobacteria-3]|jgi:flagellar protein FlgJ|nr:MAG: flagellar assembly peptidoglycan hydrolase FlgJ [Betaproteobacteria bacterium HGW-Betaproteobacteria-3]
MTALPQVSSNALSIDSRSLDSLRHAAAQDPKSAMRQAAVQFESIFMQMVMKSMREATSKSGLMDSSSVDTFTGMLDTQMTQKWGGRAGGLADMIERQLSRNMPATPSGVSNPDLPSGRERGAGAPSMTGRPVGIAPGGANPEQVAFVQKMSVHAQAAERETGVPASFILGQAALESGWGRGEIRNGDGSRAFNLLGVKATGNWKGATTDVVTTEYVDGKAMKTVEKFRAYGSYQEAFSDYARMISNSTRYGDVVRGARTAESFATGMQKAGYATDPAYANKLSRTINQTLALQRAMV